MLIAACIAALPLHAQEPATTDAPAAPAAVEPAPAAPAPATPCFPECRSGFTCHAGLCVSLCNPPCPDGYTCTEDARCQAPAPTAYTSPGISAQTLEAAAERQRLREEKRMQKQLRAAWAMVPRVTLHMEWMWMFSDIYRTGFEGAVGFQKNISPFFGIRARLGGLIGYVAPEPWDNDDRAVTWALQVDMVPFFGPLGHFFIGPMFWFEYFWNSEETLQDNSIWDDVSNVSVFEGPTGGLGIDMGVLLGDKSNFGVNWRVRTTLTLVEEFAAIFEFGFTYHFLVGK